jgi:tetratricopeptide (TPR) repeat protein
VALYRELLESKGADPNIYNLIGDVFTKVDNLEDAVPEYLSAIDLYEVEGLFENGIAVCKKILRLSPEMGDVYFRLASFYAEIGLLSEAKESLTNYVERSEDRTIVEESPQKYKKLMILLSSDERLKPVVEAAYAKIGWQEKELDALFGIVSAKPSPSLESKDVPESKKPSEKVVQEEVVTASDKQEKQPAEKPSEKAVQEEVVTASDKQEKQPAEKPSEKVVQEEVVTASDKQEKQPAEKPSEKVVQEEVVTASDKQEKQPSKSVPSDSVREPAEESGPQEELRPELREVDGNVRLPSDEEEVLLFLRTIEKIKANDSSGADKDHYEIGLLYKQLGFYDAAIREFQLSSTTGDKSLQALKEVGDCFLEKNQGDIAITAFKRAIEETSKGGKEYIALRYGIGKGYELLGDKEKAIGAFEDICLHDIGYLDVKKRLDELRGQ